jgi:hypothetical protein
MKRAWLTITTEHASLRVESRALPVPAPTDGYRCIVDAGGWRWKFQGVADRWTVGTTYGRGRVATIAVESTGSAAAERLQRPLGQRI